MRVLPLQKGILYEANHSRRLGKSLGTNLMPSNYKLCSSNCVYCHYGWMKVHTRHAGRFLKDLPEFDDVIKEIKNALISKQQFDYIAFSGNGESTLYPQFASLAAELAELRDRYRSDVKIALLSDSTGLSNPVLKKSIRYIDLPVFKLDTGIRETLRTINRPVRGVDFEEIFEQPSSLSGIFIQTVLVRDTPCNTTEEERDAYLEKIKIIQPRKVHIYSIDRPVPDARLECVFPERLDEIAHLGSEKTGVEMQVFYLT